jgi:hypothetical protein
MMPQHDNMSSSIFASSIYYKTVDLHLQFTLAVLTYSHLIPAAINPLPSTSHCLVLLWLGLLEH